MPYIQSPIDYLGFQGASLPRALFPTMNPTSFPMNPFQDSCFPTFEHFNSQTTRAMQDSLILENSHLTNQNQDKLKLTGPFDMKSLLLSGNNQCTQTNSNANISSSSNAYNFLMPCGCGMHAPGQPHIGHPTYGIGTNYVPTTSQSIGLPLKTSSQICTPNKITNEKTEERNKSTSKSPSPSPMGFKISHQTSIGNSSSSSSPSSPAPTFTASHLLGLYSQYFTNGNNNH